ncbi:MAG: hypothetical protein PUE01_13625 [Clostridiaceae bacterium]|nr:hypothetical protein [Clostridiaceae bacterium]
MNIGILGTGFGSFHASIKYNKNVFVGMFIRFEELYKCLLIL